MGNAASITIEGKQYELDTVVGSEQEKGVDITKLRGQSGYIAFDPAFSNTGACTSNITFIDGEKGILRYRGYPIEQLATQAKFSEVAYLLIFGELPTSQQQAEWSAMLTQHELLHEDMLHHFQGFPATAHPMAILSSMINASSCFYPELQNLDTGAQFKTDAARLISQIRTIASFSYKKSVGQRYMYPHPELSYVSNFLSMMFSIPNNDYEVSKEVLHALELLLILHADHEQNCSTSTVRVVASSQANLYASASAGVCALWGARHGGANQKVIEMLHRIHHSGKTVKDVVELAKTDNTQRLFGFGHAVYKNFDPRAKIIKKACDDVLTKLGIVDPMLDIAKELEEVALTDEYFVERKLYPNVDFYSGIILKAIGIPLDMFTVIFAIGRMPGWVAHWLEVSSDAKGRITRPRQIYTGPTERDFVPIDKRG